LKHKSDVFDMFKKWLVQVEKKNQVGSLSAWSPTIGENTVMADLKSYVRVEESVKWRRSRNPRQKGVVKRMNRTILERARSMRIHTGLAVLGRWSQHSSVSDQQKAIGDPKLWDSGESMDWQRGKLEPPVYF